MKNKNKRNSLKRIVGWYRNEFKEEKFTGRHDTTMWVKVIVNNGVIKGNIFWKITYIEPLKKFQEMLQGQTI